MIGSFKHKGLEQLYGRDVSRGVNREHVRKLKQILQVLVAADVVEAVDLPTFRRHELKGARKGTWAVVVRANWRVTFRFVDGKAEDVDYEDYH